MFSQFQLFLQQYWPLSKTNKYQPTDEEFKTLKRRIWCCNLRGVLIDKLAKFNSSSLHVTKDDEDDWLPSLIDEFRETDYNTTTIYPCGHCFMIFMCIVEFLII